MERGLSGEKVCDKYLVQSMDPEDSDLCYEELEAMICFGIQIETNMLFLLWRFCAVLNKHSAQVR